MIEGCKTGPVISRRGLLASAAGAGLLVAGRGALAAGTDVTDWTPEKIGQIAGTITVDTAAECAKVVPLDTKGRVTYWYVGPNQATPDVEKKTDDAFWAAFAKTYPNITVEKQNLDYNTMLNKLRTAALGNAAPMLAKMPIMWGVEFAAKGQLSPLRPEDVGQSTSDYWPEAMKSTAWQGKNYGIPTNNETMGLIWNGALFRQAGFDPDRAPETWDDLAAYSKAIKDKTGKNGYGLVARANAGNTPFRFMPQLWAYGGAALDETADHPTYKKVELNNAGSKAALQLSYDMYDVAKSVPVSALTNTQTENEDPFIAGQLGMMIGHPAEYALMLDKAAKATGDDRKVADAVVANMRYGLIPKGPARRAVVFGGSNVHMFKPNLVDGKMDDQAARALVAFMTGPEWSTKLLWVSSNPGNRRGFRTVWMKQRLEQIKFLNVTTSMLAYGIPFPVVPESGEIMNVIVPDMMQNALTKRMTVPASADAAAARVKSLVTGL